MKKITKNLLKVVYQELINSNEKIHDIYLKSVIVDYIYNIEDIIKWSKNKNIYSLKYQVLLNIILSNITFVLGHDINVYEVSKNDYTKLFKYSISRLKNKFEKRVYLHEFNDFINSETGTSEYSSSVILLLSMPGLIPKEFDEIL